MTTHDESPLREGLRIGASFALGFSVIAALPMGVLGAMLCVESMAGAPVTVTWSGYGALILVVFGSYVAAGAIAGPLLVVLRPIRTTALGWLVTGMLISLISHGTMAVAFAELYGAAGMYVLEHSSAEAWQMLPPALLLFGMIGGGMGLVMWARESRPSRAPASSPAATRPMTIVQRTRATASPLLLVVAAIAFVAWVRLAPHSPVRFQPQIASETSTATSSGVITNGISDSTDALARHFIRLAQRHVLDSAGHLVSPTVHLRDSTLLVQQVATHVPADTTLALEQTVAERWTPGKVTRTIEAYALRTRTDSETVVLQTVEEMGVRWIERATVAHGVLRTLPEVASASDSAAVRLAADTTPFVRPWQSMR